VQLPDLPAHPQGQHVQAQGLQEVGGLLRHMLRHAPAHGAGRLHVQIGDLHAGQPLGGAYDPQRLHLHLAHGLAETPFHAYGQFLDHRAANLQRRADGSPVLGTDSMHTAPQHAGQAVWVRRAGVWTRAVLIEPPDQEAPSSCLVRAADGTGGPLRVASEDVRALPRADGLSLGQFAQGLSASPSEGRHLAMQARQAPARATELARLGPIFARWLDQHLRSQHPDPAVREGSPYEQWTPEELRLHADRFQRMLRSTHLLPGAQKG
jgi:hypothetical protein